eukprot:gene28220-35039_t
MRTACSRSSGSRCTKGSGTRATPMPTEAISTSQSHWPLCAAMSGVMPASAKALRSARVRAKSSFSSTSGSVASSFSRSVRRLRWKVPAAASA